MDRRILLWIIIGILFIAVLFLTFKTGSAGSGTVQAAASTVKTAASSSGMVGGC